MPMSFLDVVENLKQIDFKSRHDFKSKVGRENKLSDKMIELKFRCNKCKSEIGENWIYEALEDKEEQIIEECEKYGGFWSVLKDFDSDLGHSDEWISLPCPNCEKDFQTFLDCDFIYYTEEGGLEYWVDQLDQYVLIDVNGATPVEISGIASGKEISDLLKRLSVRWSHIGKRIHICSAFIDSIGWELICHHFPADKTFVYTRTVGFENLNKWIKRKEKEWMDREPNGPLWYEELGLPSPRHICKTIVDDSHAKFYSAIIDKEVEILESSFNLIESELNKKENFRFAWINQNEFFKNYLKPLLKRS